MEVICLFLDYYSVNLDEIINKRLAIVEKEIKVEMSTHDISRVLSASLLVKIFLRNLLEQYHHDEARYQSDRQLTLNLI